MTSLRYFQYFVFEICFLTHVVAVYRFLYGFSALEWVCTTTKLIFNSCYLKLPTFFNSRDVFRKHAEIVQSYRNSGFQVTGMIEHVEGIFGVSNFQFFFLL